MSGEGEGVTLVTNSEVRQCRTRKSGPFFKSVQKVVGSGKLLAALSAVAAIPMVVIVYRVTLSYRLAIAICCVAAATSSSIPTVVKPKNS